MKFFKRLFCKHKWARYDELIEQLFVGGYAAFQRCQKCKKIKFGSCEKNGPEEPGWKEHKAEIDRIMATDYSTGSEPESK